MWWSPQPPEDPDLAFLNEVSSVPLQQALRHQHKAFGALYARRARYPRFKPRCSRQSAHYTRSAFSLRGGELRLAKMSEPLAFVWSWPDADVTALDPAMVIVSRAPDGRWYVTFTIDAPGPQPLPAAGHAVGVDLGVTDFAVTSDGERVVNPRRLERKACNLARYQRVLARRQRGSANRAKAAAKVARTHRKVRNARRDFLHRASTRLVRKADVVVIEDLAVKNMAKNRRLAKAISDCGWGEFRRLLTELSLSTRRWMCPVCRARYDRDINAAKNIVAAGRAVARGCPGDACGADVRHSGPSRVRSAVKQERRIGADLCSGGPEPVTKPDGKASTKRIPPRRGLVRGRPGSRRSGSTTGPRAECRTRSAAAPAPGRRAWPPTAPASGAPRRVPARQR
jgi:putative transposase